MLAEASLSCVERGRAAMDMVALGARGVVIVMATSATNSSSNVQVVSLALAGLQQPLAAPTWSVSASNGAALLSAAGLRLRMPGLAAGLARTPSSWSDAGATVDLDVPGGIVSYDSAAAAAAEEERRQRVIGGAVGGLLLGGAGLATLCGVALFAYRRRQRRYAAFSEAGGLWEQRERAAGGTTWGAPQPPPPPQVWSVTVAPPQAPQQNPMWLGGGGGGAGVPAEQSPPPSSTWSLAPPPPQQGHELLAAASVLGLPAAAPPPDWAPRQASTPQAAVTRSEGLFTEATTPFDVEQAGALRSPRSREPNDNF